MNRRRAKNAFTADELEMAINFQDQARLRAADDIAKRDASEDHLVVEKFSRSRQRWESIKSPSGDPILHRQRSTAESLIGSMKGVSIDRLRIRSAFTNESRTGVFYERKYLVSTSERLRSELVDVFDDLETRKFAIASRAPDENAFVFELAKKLAKRLAAGTDASNETKLVALLPLIVDICCKYRGYKVDSVQQRVVLVAGDLEMPSVEGMFANEADTQPTDTLR